MLLRRSKDNEKLKTYDYIVIDEISMIDGHKFDEIIDRIKFLNKKRSKKIGEIKLIICGDPLQLPPVENDSGYFFNAGQFADFEKSSYTCVLREVKRQNNKEFIDVLSRVRLGIKNKEDIKYITDMKNNQVDPNDSEVVYMCAKIKTLMK